MANSNDIFSRLVNWFTSAGRDKQPISRSADQQDLFSKLMNKFSG